MHTGFAVLLTNSEYFSFSFFPFPIFIKDISIRQKWFFHIWQQFWFDKVLKIRNITWFLGRSYNMKHEEFIWKHQFRTSKRFHDIVVCKNKNKKKKKSMFVASETFCLKKKRERKCMYERELFRDFSFLICILVEQYFCSKHFQ